MSLVKLHIKTSSSYNIKLLVLWISILSNFATLIIMLLFCKNTNTIILQVKQWKKTEHRAWTTMRFIRWIIINDELYARNEHITLFKLKNFLKVLNE